MVENENQDFRAYAWLRDNPGNKVGNLPTLFSGVSLASPGIFTSATNTITVLDGIHWVINYNLVSHSKALNYVRDEQHEPSKKSKNLLAEGKHQAICMQITITFDLKTSSLPRV